MLVLMREDITYGELAAAYALPLSERESDAPRTDAPPGRDNTLAPWPRP